PRTRPGAPPPEAGAAEPLALLVLCDHEADGVARVLRAVGDDGRRCRRGAQLGLARPAPTRALSEELRRVGGGERCSLGIDALLPARLRLGAHAVPLAASDH